MDIFFEDGINIIKYFTEEVDNYRIHIYYNDYEEKKIEEEMLNNQQLPVERYYLKERVSEFTGEDRFLHIFYERKHFYAINIDGSSHKFKLGLTLPENILKYFTNKYKNFKLMKNGKLESGTQNKVFYIELMLSESIQNKKSS